MSYLDLQNITRRHFLRDCGTGLGGMWLANQLAQAGALKIQHDSSAPLAPLAPQMTPKVKRVIYLHMIGAPSQLELFDYKPELKKYDGKDCPQEFLEGQRFAFIQGTPQMLGPVYDFKQHGQSGAWISDRLPHLAKHADDLCFVKTMVTDQFNHGPAQLMVQTGQARLGAPSIGSWVTYGLGSENQNLPGFVSMCPGGYPVSRTQNWQSGFLPAAYQGTYVNTKTTDPRKLIEHVIPKHLPRHRQREQLDFLRQLNEEHAAARDYDSDLEARLQSFELAYRMQLEATDAFDVTQEPKHIREMYGDTLQGRQMLITRRLVERGVRFVQVWHGAGQPWDNHDDLEKNHRKLAQQCDQAIGALLQDLKQRGMLDETLVLWGGEFGRTPVVEMPKEGTNQGKINGRDHNHYGFTTWMAGGGTKGGHIHGATDDFGFQAVKDKVHVHDLHATMLHLLGFDHEELTYRYSGRDFRLTDVHGHVVHDLLA